MRISNQQLSAELSRDSNASEASITAYPVRHGPWLSTLCILMRAQYLLLLRTITAWLRFRRPPLRETTGSQSLLATYGPPASQRCDQREGKAAPV